MSTRDLALEWMTRWRERVSAVKSPTELRLLHRWLWRTWTCVGPSVTAQVNRQFGLSGADEFQPDMPHAFAGRFETARMIFVNINPGWKKSLNEKEERIVRRSEPESWDFCRSLFTRYPPEVGQMWWWNGVLGVAWRIEHGRPPVGLSAREKRNWANENVAGIELLPVHSTSAGFLRGRAIGRTPDLWTAMLAGMRETLHLALRLGVPLVLVASRDGAAFVRQIASASTWRPLPFASGLPAGTTAYATGESTVVAIPRPFVTKHSRLAPDAVAEAIRETLAASHSSGTST